MKTQNKALRYLSSLDIVVASVSLIVLVTITFFGVIMRYFFNNPFVWLEEVQLWCLVWIVFLGSGAAFRTGSHVAIEVVVDRMPSNLRKIVEVFGYVVVMFILIFFMIHGSNLIKQLFNTGRTTNILDVPYPLIYAAFPIGCVLMMINYTVVTVTSLFNKDSQLDVEGGE